MTLEQSTTLLKQMVSQTAHLGLIDVEARALVGLGISPDVVHLRSVP